MSFQTIVYLLKNKEKKLKNNNEGFTYKRKSR